MTGDFRNWVARLFQTKTAARAANRRTPRRAPVFRIESLEDRVVPAITITDLATGGSLDADLLADGMVTGDGTISRGALTSVPAATNISVTAATGSITFNGFAATVTLLTGGGSSATFTAPGVISFADLTDNFNTSGGGLVFVAGGSASLPALSGGSLDVTAGGATTVGSATTTGGIDITSTGGAVNSLGTLQTPGQLTLAAAFGITVQTSAATLQAINSTAGAITVTQTAAPSQLLTITNTAGGVVNNAPGEAITITNLGSGIQLGTSAPVQTAGGGDITLSAQDIIIDASATIAAGTGVTTLANSDAGRQINLGGNGVTVGKLTLTQAELDRVTGTGALRIGSTTSGAFEVNAPITRTTSVLSLLSGAAMIETGTGAITATNLRLSGPGPITLDNPANAVANLVADLGPAPAGLLTFVDSVLLTVGASIDGVTGITSADGNVMLVANKMNVANPIAVGNSATGGIVTLQPLNATVNVDLGSLVDTNASLELSNAEVNRVTARVLRVGVVAGSVDVNVTAPITLGANVPTLSLIAGNAITQTNTAVVTVTNLRVTAPNQITLDDAANEVSSLAGSMTAVNSFFEYRDATGFVIDTVDGVAGVSTNTASLNSNLSLTAGGAVTQTAGANVVTAELELLGAGSFTLNNAGNDVQEIGALLTTPGTGTLSYTDANNLSVARAENTDGVATTNSAITITTLDGDLTVSDTATAFDVNAGSATVALTAGVAGVDRQINLVAGSNVTGLGGVTYTADFMTLSGSTNAGISLALLQPFEAGTLIDLGGGGGANTLGLGDGELDSVTAGVLRVGNATAGDITITSAISPANTSQLELVTGAGILDGSAGLDDITETRLGLTAGTGIGVAGGDMRLDIVVSNVEATTGTGGIQLANTGRPLTIGGVNGTLGGLTVTTSGSITLTETGTSGAANRGHLTVDEPVTTAAGSVYLQNIDPNSIVTLAVNAAVTATGGTVMILGEDNVTVAAPVSATGDITLTADANDDGSGDLITSGAGTVSTSGGSILMAAEDNVSIGAAVTVTAGPGTITLTADTDNGGVGNLTVAADVTTFAGAITARAGGRFTNQADIAAGGGATVVVRSDDMDLQAGSTITTTGIVNLRADTAGVGIDLGSAAAGTGAVLRLSDAELDTVTAGDQLILTSSADVSVTATITLDPARVATLFIEANFGGVIDGTAADVQDDLFVESLAITSATGVGSANTLNIAVTNLAVANTTTGNVFITTHAFSAGGPLNITTVAGVVGVVNAGPGNTFVGNTGGLLSVVEQFVGTGGGSVILTNSGAGADILVDANGRVAASGGNGTVTIDSSAATSGGQVTINSTTGVEVQAAGTGNVTISARAGVTIGAGVDVQSGNLAAGGDIMISANVGVAAGGADITLGASSFVNTRGNISLTTDPDGILTGTAGADIVMDPTSIIKGNGNVAANHKALTVTLRADGDVVVSNVWADTDLGIVAAENIVDDGDVAGETFIQAVDIQLIAGGFIGGAVQITPTDVFSGNTLTPTAAYRGAIDYDLDNNGSLIVTQGAAVVLTGTGGNVQLRQVDDLEDVNPEPVRTSDLNFAAASINADNQLAVVSSAGDFLVDSGFVVPSNADLLFATTAGGSIVITGGVTNPGGMNADTVLVASGSPTASITGTVGGVADVVGPNVNLVTTGGSIGVSPAATLEINATRLDGQTTGGGAAGGSAFITDTQNGVAVGRFDAGGGDVVLRSLGNNGITANITAVSPNDNVAEIIANTVTLDTTAAGAVTGPNGQIGLPGTFFEVNANVINAATNNSSLWVSELNGAQIGSVNAGTGTAFLRVRGGGTLTSDDPGTADVVAATVSLSGVAGEGANFGTSLASPLEINATTLNVNLPGGGSAFVADTAGGLLVQRAVTTTGDIGVRTIGGGLTLGNASTTTAAVQTTTGTVTLNAAGAILGNSVAGPLDVIAPALSATAAAGLGTAANVLLTRVTNLAFSNLAGAVNVLNSGPLTVTVVGALATSSNLGTTTTITATSPLTFAVNTTTTGDTVYTAGEVADAGVFADDLTINAGVTVSVTAGNLTLQAGDEIVLNGTSVATASGTITLNVGFNDLDGVGGAVIRGTIDAGSGVPAAVGGAGADQVLVDFTGGAALPDGLSFSGGAAADVLQVSDAGGAAARSYIVSATGVTRDGAAAIAFAADVETARVVGGNLADIFAVNPTATTAIDVQGGSPTAAPGDQLLVINSGPAFLSTTGTGSVSGTYDFPAGTSDVTFSNIEQLNTGADAVSVTKTDGMTTALPGTTVTYTVVVTNNATTGLGGIRVQDTVPAALTGVSFTAVFSGTGSAGNVGPTAGNTIDETISLAAGGTATYTITGTLAPTTPAGSLANIVTVTPPAGVTDDTTNNSATDTDNVVPTGDVVVTKTNGTTTTVPGTTTTYTIVVSNTGPSTVTVSFLDMFPAAITSASRTVMSAGGATGGTAGTGNIADTLTLPGGGTVTYTVTAAVNPAASGTLTNSATATVLTPGFDQGGSTANDSASDTDTLTPQGDVVVTKTDGVTTVTAGTTTTYTITVSNTGPSTVTVPFADNLPPQIASATRTVVNGGGASGGTAGTGNIAEMLTLPAGGTVTYTVAAMISPAAPAGTLTNTATATVSGSFDQGGSTANDSATDTNTLVAAPDLAVSATAPATAKVGTAFTYTFNVSNFGASTQTGVVLSHTLPVKSINSSASSTQGTATIAGGVLTAAIGTLAPGAFANVTVTLTPTDDGSFVLVATATGALPEPVTTNNSAGAVTQVAPYQPLIVAGPGNGGGAEVRVLNADTGALESRFIPFGPFFSAAMSVAQGDINGDGVPEIIVGAGPGGAARVSVFDVRTGAVLMNFFAFEPSVTGGVNVGAGDLDGDGKDEVLTGAGAGFGPRVRAFNAAGQEVRSFFAYAPNFTGGVRVAVGDINGDGRMDIITGAGGGGSAHVKAFDGTSLAELQSFFAFDSGLREGVFVAAADVNGDGIAEIVAGAGGGGASHIKLFDGKSLAERASFFAFAPTARDGVTVAATDRGSNGRENIVAGTGVGVQAQVKVFGETSAEEAVFNAFDIGFISGVFVG